MRLIALGCLMIILSSSCTRETNWVVIDSYPNGKVKNQKEYYLDESDTVYVSQQILSNDGVIQLEGGLEDGERVGQWKSFYPDGTTWSETHFSKGITNGLTKTYYPNGRLRYAGYYFEGEKDGEWIWYDSTGVLNKKANYKLERAD